MSITLDGFFDKPQDYFVKSKPDRPVYFFSPARLQSAASEFQSGFEGLVTYAVKANDGVEVLTALMRAGINAFDVASPVEMGAVRRHNPRAVLHYHNPVRSMDEIEQAKAFGISSWAIDDFGELDKLGSLVPKTEIAIRLKLPVRGAAYAFGEKFGPSPELAKALLQEVAKRGHIASMTFHPGTQCRDPKAWASYIQAAADVTAAANVPLQRLNIGGGFPSWREAAAPELLEIFRVIDQTKNCYFTNLAGHHNAPILVCEPGRAMVGDAFALGLRVKSLRSDGSVVLNDGVYGALAEWRDMRVPDETRMQLFDPTGQERRGAGINRRVFGPTCDSLDRVPPNINLPSDMKDGDYLLIQGMRAYSVALTCRFNGYGNSDRVFCLHLS